MTCRCYFPASALLTVALAIASPADARVAAPGAFVTTEIHSVQDLVRAAETDPRVRARFARQFGLPVTQVAPYFRDHLMLTRLQRPRWVTLYRVGRRGRIYSARRRLPTGTPIFTLRSGEPLLTAVGANPLRRRLPELAVGPRLAGGTGAGSMKAGGPKKAGGETRRAHRARGARPHGSEPKSATLAPEVLHRDTGRAFLLPHQREAAGYGLYSYLLFGTPPSDASHDRYLQAICAYLTIPPIAGMEQYIPRGKLNITYLPIATQPSARPTPEWVLDHYDYDRARALIDRIDGTHQDGPYIVSVLRPLPDTRLAAVHYLYQDLSSIPPNVILLWVKEFLAQVEQDRFWEERATEHFVLVLRTNIARVARAWPPVHSAVTLLINWRR
jgi:hypothetical protein